MLAEPLEALGAEALLVPVIEIRRGGRSAVRSSKRFARLDFLRLADLHQRQRRPTFRRSFGSVRSRPAGAEGAHLRDRPGDASGGRGAASEGRRDAGRSTWRRASCRRSREDLQVRSDFAATRGRRSRSGSARIARRGAQVDVVEAYRTVAPPGLAELRAPGDREKARTGSRSPVRRR